MVNNWTTTERHLRKTVLAGMVIWMFAQIAAAAVDPFYLDIYRRGLAHFEAGDYANAARELRIAAFGFVDSLDQFETAHIYAAVAASKRGLDADARLSAQRVLAAEKVSATYPGLSLPADVRAQFETIAKTALTPSELAYLHSHPAEPPPPRVVPQVTTHQTTPVPAPGPVPVPPTVVAAAPQPQPQPSPATIPHYSSAPAPPPLPPTVVATAPQPQPQPAPVMIPNRASTNGIADLTPPPRPTPTPATPVPVPAPQPVPQTSGSVADAERAVAAGNLAAARAIYNARLEAPQVTHGELLKIGEGLYRARDFRGAVRAFARVGTPARGEEPYRYYFAVSLYETGQYAAAKRELKAALPFIELTPDVDRYRAKIEGAIE